LSVDVQFPHDYTVNFTGSLNQVKIFNHKQPHAVNYQTKQDVVEWGYKFGASSPGTAKASVKATIPKQGRRFKFEKILVVGGNAQLSISYAANTTECEKAWWQNLWEQLP